MSNNGRSNALAGHAGSYRGYSLAQALDGIAAAGFQFVELTSIRGVLEQVRLDASASELRETKSLLRQSGLAPVSLSGHSDLTTEPGVVDAKRALRICEQLQIPILTTAVGGAFNEEEDESAFLSNIPPVAATAAALGVKIGLEIHGSLTGTGTMTRRLVEKVSHPSVGVVYDTANCEYYAGVSATNDLPDTAPYVIHCHLKDTPGGKGNWNFPSLGEGKVDFRRVVSTLSGYQYSGPFSVEIEFDGKLPHLDRIDVAMASSYRYLRELGVS